MDRPNLGSQGLTQTTESGSMHDGQVDVVAVFVRAAGYGALTGALFGAVAMTLISIIDGEYFWEPLIVGPAIGAGFGALTGSILALMVLVTFRWHMPAVLRRALVTLTTTFVVGGLGGLVGASAPSIALTFGLPATVAVWFVYPRILFGKIRNPMSKLNGSN